MPSEAEIEKLVNVAYKSRLPQWELDYMANIRNNLQVHTKGLLFSKVDTLFPNEHPDSKAHCINTYEPITKGSIWKAINNIGRIFSNSSFPVSASEATLDYINKNIFEGENLFTYYLQDWIDNTIATDPNGLCAVYPPEYMGGQKIEFIKSEHIRKLSKDMVVFISEEESEKKYEVCDSVVKREVFLDPNIKQLNAKRIVEKTYNQYIKTVIVKEVFHVFTRDAFIRFELEGENFEWEVFPFKVIHENIPAFKLTSVNLMLNINESFVAPFIPFGNLTLLQHRNHRAVDLMFSYPRMSEIQTPCDNLSCNDGICRDENNEETSCSRCGGSGFVTVQSPYKVYQKRIDTGLSDPEAIKQLLSSSPVDFHTPDTSILNYSKDSWKGYLSMAEEAVFIQQKQMTGNVESGKAKEIDKESEYSWMQNISRAYNNDLTKVIQAQEYYLGGRQVVGIEQPTSFAIVTETEAFENLDIIISSDAPIFIKAQKVNNFVSKFISKSSPVIKALNVLKQVDPLLFYSTKDAQTFKSNSVISIESWIIHVYAYPILMQMYDEDNTIFEKEVSEIVPLVLEKIPKQSNDLKTEILKSA